MREHQWQAVFAGLLTEMHSKLCAVEAVAKVEIALDELIQEVERGPAETASGQSS